MPRKNVDPEAVYSIDEIKRIMRIARTKSPFAFALTAWCYEFGARTAEPGLQLLRDVDLANKAARPVHLKSGATKTWHFLLPFCQESLPLWLTVRKGWKLDKNQSKFLFPSHLESTRCYTCQGTGERAKLLRLEDGSRKKGRLVKCHHCGGTGKRWGLDRREVYNCLAPILRDAGMPKGRQHPHTLRHSIITHMHNAGVDIKVIQDRVGHMNIANTFRYVHATDAQRLAVVEKMSSIYKSS